MLLRITNVPRPYAWGSRSAIAELRGVSPSGEPEAELWLGTHPGSPTAVVGADAAGLPPTLAEVVASEGAGAGSALGADRLPFLLKVLAAAAPLSLQAHPTAEQAREGFARENAAGIPVDASHRNYRDPFPKPEIIVALSERFDALCGFRDPHRSAAAIRELAGGDGVVSAFAERVEAEPLGSVFEWLLTRGDGVDVLLERVSALAGEGRGAAAETVRMLAAEYPGDPGVVVALLLNRVSLARGEALFLPAGNIHAYLGGLGVELMTASDNVLRGGLTPKHVDVPELMSVLDFAPQPVPFIAPVPIADGVESFRPSGVGFELLRVGGGASHPAPERSIVLCTAGSGEVGGGETATVALGRGEALYVSAGESAVVTAAPGGELVVAAAC